jgi:hypothetical protein
MLILKMSTYLSVKMHPKKVLATKQIFRVVDFLLFGDQKYHFCNEPLNIQKNVFNKLIVDFCSVLVERGHRVKIDFPYCLCMPKSVIFPTVASHFSDTTKATVKKNMGNLNALWARSLQQWHEVAFILGTLASKNNRRLLSLSFLGDTVY